MRQCYELECPDCGEFTRVLMDDDDNFPIYCPLCGAEAETEVTDLELEQLLTFDIQCGTMKVKSLIPSLLNIGQALFT